MPAREAARHEHLTRTSRRIVYAPQSSLHTSACFASVLHSLRLQPHLSPMAALNTSSRPRLSCRKSRSESRSVGATSSASRNADAGRHAAQASAA